MLTDRLECVLQSQLRREEGEVSVVVEAVMKLLQASAAFWGPERPAPSTLKNALGAEGAPQGDSSTLVSELKVALRQAIPKGTPASAVQVGGRGIGQDACSSTNHGNAFGCSVQRGAAGASVVQGSGPGRMQANRLNWRRESRHQGGGGARGAGR